MSSNPCLHIPKICLLIISYPHTLTPSFSPQYRQCKCRMKLLLLYWLSRVAWFCSKKIKCVGIFQLESLSLHFRDVTYYLPNRAVKKYMNRRPGRNCGTPCSNYKLHMDCVWTVWIMTFDQSYIIETICLPVGIWYCKPFIASTRKPTPSLL